MDRLINACLSDFWNTIDSSLPFNLGVSLLSGIHATALESPEAVCVTVSAPNHDLYAHDFTILWSIVWIDICPSPHVFRSRPLLSGTLTIAVFLL